MCGVLLTNRNPVTNETILDGWAESTSHDTECVTGTPCPTSVKNISFVTEWLRLGKSYREVSTYYLDLELILLVHDTPLFTLFHVMGVNRGIMSRSILCPYSWY